MQAPLAQGCLLHEILSAFFSAALLELYMGIKIIANIVIVGVNSRVASAINYVIFIHQGH